MAATGPAKAVAIVTMAGLVLLQSVSALSAAQQNDRRGLLSDPNIRRKTVAILTERALESKKTAWQAAKAQRRPTKWQVNDTVFELMSIRNGRLYVYKTCNANAAVTIAADRIRNTGIYDVDGTGLVAGLWDAGAVRTTHQELFGRVALRNGAVTYDHSTHVAGTLAAAGVVSNAQGMAPAVLIDSYDWDNDIAEMASVAMSYPQEPGTIQVSNHSYGYAAGWDNFTSPPHWYGTWGNRESDYFGMYDAEVAQWDQICYDAPYYLPCKCAGNDRSDKAPAEGEVFEYYKFPRWRTKTYNSATDPYDDGWDNGGFDTILPISCAKNILTVGAVHDAVTAGLRDLSKASMTTFSGWGPTDDGRIKPDVVANGILLYSPIAAGDTSYDSYTGTSMAAPSAAGALVLLADYYAGLFPTQAPLASTLKALIIHTADGLGNPGPDYKFGWGLINVEAAAEQIRNHCRAPDANAIVEDFLDTAHPARSYRFEWDGFSPIRATLCWTDPPGPGSDGLDDPTPQLINDLDLRIIAPNDTATYLPFILDPANPAAAASTGDNFRDNVEQVLIASPNTPGTFTVTVTHKAVLTHTPQYFSLVITGQKLIPGTPADFSCDGTVDSTDLWFLADHWLDSSPAADIYPPSGDAVVDMRDYATLARSWLR